MITLRTCSGLEEAEVIKSVLAGSGVESFVPDENTVLWSNAIGGIRVQVAEADVERANDVLRQSEQIPSEPPVNPT